MARVASTNRQLVKHNHVKETPARVVKFAAHGLTSAEYGLTAVGTPSVDTSIFRIEDSTLKMTISDNTFAQWKGFFEDTLDFNSPNGIALSFYIPNTLRGTGASAAPYMVFSFSNTATSKASPAARSNHSMYFYEVRNGWNYVRLRPDDSSSDAALNSPFVGNIGWSAVTTGASMATAVNWLSIDMYNFNGRDIYFEGIYRGGSNRSKFCWQFDNWGAVVQETVDVLFPANDWKWVIDVPDNYVVADADLLARIDASLPLGAELVLNDTTDRSLTALSREQVRDMVAANKIVFDSRGWAYDPRFYIYNNNVYNDAVVAGLQDAGIKYARAGENELWINNIEQGIPNPLRYGSKSMDNTTYATLKIWLDRAIQYQCDIHWYQHNLVVGGVVGGGGQTGVAITSITSASTIATVTTTVPHGINTTGRVTIAGCTGDHAAKFNISTNVTVTGLDTFTYVIADASDTSAEGTPTYSNIACSTALSQYSEDFLAFAAYVKACENLGLLEVIGLTEWWDSL